MPLFHEKRVHSKTNFREVLLNIEPDVRLLEWRSITAKKNKQLPIKSLIPLLPQIQNDRYRTNKLKLICYMPVMKSYIIDNVTVDMPFRSDLSCSAVT